MLLILLFVFTCCLNNGRSEQSIASFFTQLSYVPSFCSHAFLKKDNWIFVGFLSVPHLVDILAGWVDEWCRNLMCKRTLPSLRASSFTISVLCFDSFFTYSDSGNSGKLFNYLIIKLALSLDILIRNFKRRTRR